MEDAHLLSVSPLEKLGDHCSWLPDPRGHSILSCKVVLWNPFSFSQSASQELGCQLLSKLELLSLQSWELVFLSL